MLKMIAAGSAFLLFYVFFTYLINMGGRNRRLVCDRINDFKSERSEQKPEKRKVKRERNKNGDGNAIAKTKKQLEKLENQIYDAGIRIPVQSFLMLWIVFTIAVPLILLVTGVPGAISVAAALLCALGPIVFIKTKKKKRRAELEGQLVEAISILCNALRAGHSFQAAMNTISKEMTGVISEEFGRVFRETQRGMTLEESMTRMVERSESQDLDMLCTAVLIQREVGGNLAEVLGNISDTIQSRLNLKAEIKTRTASGRLSGYLVGSLPILLLIAISAINPEYSQALYNTSAGNTMLIIGGLMEVTGFIVIQKVVSIKY